MIIRRWKWVVHRAVTYGEPICREHSKTTCWTDHPTRPISPPAPVVVLQTKLQWRMCPALRIGNKGNKEACTPISDHRCIDIAGIVNTKCPGTHLKRGCLLGNRRNTPQD